MELVFSTNFVGVFAPLTDLHNSISELGAKTAQTVCAIKRRYQPPPLFLSGFHPEYTVKEKWCFDHIMHGKTIAL